MCKLGANTDADGAFYIAQLIRDEVEKLKITDISLNLTIANMIPRKNLEAQALMMAAENR